jgi:hypothetical protein
VGVITIPDCRSGPIEEGRVVPYGALGLSAGTELRALLADLEVAAGEMDLSHEAIELILGLPPGGADMVYGRRAFTAGAEAQLRRLLEVLHLARLLSGPSDVPGWLRRGDPRLGHATPTRTMQRPGGLSVARDLLRYEWEEFVEGGFVSDGLR